MAKEVFKSVEIKKKMNVDEALALGKGKDKLMAAGLKGLRVKLGREPTQDDIEAAFFKASSKCFSLM